MPIQKTSSYEDYQFGIEPRYYSNTNQTNNKQNLQKQASLNSQSLGIHPQYQQQYSPRIEHDDINEIRKLVREQTNLQANKSNVVIRHRSSNSDSSDDIEVPVRRFTPLPDIPRAEDTYFRTESRLIKDEKPDAKESNNHNLDDANKLILTNYQYNTKDCKLTDTNIFVNESSSSYPNSNNKHTRYHFGSSNRVYRLPAIEKQINHTLHNTMDLDEDLPMNPVNIDQDQKNTRMIYTSPGDRIISPIKRPQAPSPAASAYRRKTRENSDSEPEDDFICKEIM